MPKREQSESAHRYWDTIIKATTALLGLTTIIGGIVQFGTNLTLQRQSTERQQASENNLRERELSKPIRDLKLEVTEELVVAVATLVHEKRYGRDGKEVNPKWNEAIKRFRTTYDGRFFLIKSPQSDKVATDLYNRLGEIQEDQLRPHLNDLAYLVAAGQNLSKLCVDELVSK